MEKIPVLAVVGPTASGKTALGASLAKRFGGEVISADSMQIYEGLDIASAKPSEAEMLGVPHHLISVIPRTQNFSVAEYATLAGEKIREVYSRGKLPVLVGGTGLYIDAVLSGMQFSQEGDPQLRSELTKRLETEGRDALYAQLCSLDPEAAASIHPNNAVRVIRALEVCLGSGMTFTEYKRQNAAHPSPYNARIIGLDYADRAVLYDRIDRRVTLMLEQGLTEEVRALSEQGQSGTSACAIGYKELLPYLDGTASLENCADLIRQETRRYAKRQLTWFRRNAQIMWLILSESDELAKILEKAEKMIAKNQILWYNE